MGGGGVLNLMRAYMAVEKRGNLGIQPRGPPEVSDKHMSGLLHANGSSTIRRYAVSYAM